MVEDQSGPGGARNFTTELEQTVLSAHRMGRPFLWHLNADTSWILSLPYPIQSATLGKTRFNILIDPWLRGPQKDVAGWFSTQWHLIDSSVQTIDELNRILADVEMLSAANGVIKEIEPTEENRKTTRNIIDLVIISHEFSDHCHQATLLEVNPAVPVLASQKAASLIRSWNHFQVVVDVPPFDPSVDWRETSCSPLPSWLAVQRLVTKTDALYYHSAVIICFRTSDGNSGNTEAVVYTPHGVEFNSFSVLSSAQPPIKTLALLHGLHDVSLRMNTQLNLGGHNALKIERLLAPKYWVTTHDEIKRGGGLVSFFLRRKIVSLSEALLKETTESGVKTTQKLNGSFSELGSGQSLLLE